MSNNQAPAPINVDDYEKIAREKMNPMFFDYYASGADDELTLHENTAAYSRLKLQYRVLRGITAVDTRSSLLGHDLAWPLLIAPSGFQKLAHPEGELAMVRGATQAQVPMILSTAATTPMEEVTAVAQTPIWFQLYMYKDRGLTQALVQRAEAAGCRAIALTVDTPVLGQRERDVRNGFTLPPGMSLGNLMSHEEETMPTADGSALAKYTSDYFKMSLDWDDVAWLCAHTRLPVLLKGVCHPADAIRGLDYGIEGVIVSNHGGRQLDSAPATIEVLPDIATAVGDRITVLVDGGIRRGGDIFKALALGADAVCVGRAPLWGLAAAGSDGVAHVLHLLRTEFERTMTLCGVKNINEISADLIF